MVSIPIMELCGHLRGGSDGSRRTMLESNAVVMVIATLQRRDSLAHGEHSCSDPATRVLVELGKHGEPSNTSICRHLCRIRRFESHHGRFECCYGDARWMFARREFSKSSSGRVRSAQ
jgi:hypothetical protein